MRRLSIILLGALATLVAACAIDIPEPEQTLTPPGSYLRLVNNFNNDAEWTGVTQLSSKAVVFFLGKESIAVPNADFLIHDCTASAPAGVEFDAATGRWTVGGEQTTIPRSNATLTYSYPVYAYYDEKELKIFASNGDFFSFDRYGYVDPEDQEGQEGQEDPEGDQGGEEDPDGDDQGDEGDQEDPPVVTPPTPKPYKIPQIEITTDGGARIANKTDYVPGTIKVTDPCCYYSDVEVLEARMKIRGRGNTTWHQPKHPYKIKLDEKAPILGIHKDKEWVLLANHFDKTLLRNIVAMEISRRLGFSWTPTLYSVEVWLNGEYVGVYSFGEHKKVSKHRVNIEVATPENNSGEGLEGGYYLELENESMNEPCWFKTERYGVTFMFHEPENPTAEQQKYMQDYVAAFEDCLYALGHTSRGPTNYYDYIDVASFVNYYIIEELTQNGDGNFRKSTFMTKERGKKLELYHVWDFDLCQGNSEEYRPYDSIMRGCVWNNRLFGKNDERWINAVKTRWNEVYPDLMTIFDFIDEQVELLDGGQYRNFEKWPILNEKLGPMNVFYGSHEGEVEHLKQFYRDRLSWLDNEIRNTM